MAAVEDAKALQKRVCDLASVGNLVELTALLEEHPEVDVDGFKQANGDWALFLSCSNGYTECARLLIDYNADVNAKNLSTGGDGLYTAARMGRLSCVKLMVQNGAEIIRQTNFLGWTPLSGSIYGGHLTVAQYLLEQNVDIHFRPDHSGTTMDALDRAMRKEATDCTPGIALAVLSCNTDAKNVNTDNYNVTAATRDAHIETYQHVQAYIDEYHRILQLMLSEHVPVDPRFGLGQMGIYQEPLERALEYLGLSMSKDQVVNTSIDGEAVRRALIPGHLLNANHWFDKYKRHKE
jgi:ankyrin repeat protein